MACTWKRFMEKIWRTVKCGFLECSRLHFTDNQLSGTRGIFICRRYGKHCLTNWILEESKTNILLKLIFSPKSFLVTCPPFSLQFYENTHEFFPTKKQYIVNSNSFYLGVHDRESMTNVQQRFHVKKIVVHKHYSQLSNTNDIALLKLSGLAKVTEKVRPIELPTPGHRIAVGTMCYMTGNVYNWWIFIITIHKDK